VGSPPHRLSACRRSLPAAGLPAAAEPRLVRRCSHGALSPCWLCAGLLTAPYKMTAGLKMEEGRISSGAGFPRSGLSV
jgi:hypothetical protein